MFDISISLIDIFDILFLNITKYTFKCITCSDKIFKRESYDEKIY